MASGCHARGQGEKGRGKDTIMTEERKRGQEDFKDREIGCVYFYKYASPQK